MFRRGREGRKKGEDGEKRGEKECMEYMECSSEEGRM